MSTDRSFKLYYLLAPFAFLYGIGVKIRNLLFDWGILPSEEYPVPVICIGNLSAGGTGKTPHTEYLIRILQKKYKLAVLSRGYKRKTKGYILASDSSTSQSIGDEPYQIWLKFPNILVAVDEDRRRGITHLLNLPAEQKPDVILLDDAFQHRYVKASFYILTTDYHRLFYKDRLLPVGRLRESATGKNRADAVIVTKSPLDLKPIDFRIIQDEMKLIPHQHLFFSHIIYGELKPIFPIEVDLLTRTLITKDDSILLIAGIASATLFIDDIKKQAKSVSTLLFPDHHAFDKQDIQKIEEAFMKIQSPDKYILMTEKDAVRINKNPWILDQWKNVFFYLPIRIGFSGKSANRLDSVIEDHITSFKRNYILPKT